MQLEIINDEALDLDEFMPYLINKIQEYFISNISRFKLIKYDAFLNTYTNLMPAYPSEKKRKISVYDILVGAIYHLVWQKAPNNNYYIFIDINSYIPNYNAKFIDIASMVNFGNLSLRPYPIFDDTFNYIADNIDYYFDNYLKGVE